MSIPKKAGLELMESLVSSYHELIKLYFCGAAIVRVYMCVCVCDVGIECECAYVWDALVIGRIVPFGHRRGCLSRSQNIKAWNSSIVNHDHKLKMLFLNFV